MDAFIDKLAQKFTASEVIKGNHEAEAKEIEQLKAQIETYEKLLQDMKLVNLKNMESAEKLNKLAEETANALKKEAEQGEPSYADKELVQQLFDKQSDTIHKENVKVYRNVQAAVGDVLKDQTKSILDAQSQAAKKSGTGFLKVMSVLIFIAVLADIALKVLTMFGYI